MDDSRTPGKIVPRPAYPVVRPLEGTQRPRHSEGRAEEVGLGVGRRAVDETRFPSESPHYQTSSTFSSEFEKEGIVVLTPRYHARMSLNESGSAVPQEHGPDQVRAQRTTSSPDRHCRIPPPYRSKSTRDEPPRHGRPDELDRMGEGKRDQVRQGCQ